MIAKCMSRVFVATCYRKNPSDATLLVLWNYACRASAKQDFSSSSCHRLRFYHGADVEVEFGLLILLEIECAKLVRAEITYDAHRMIELIAEHLLNPGYEVIPEFRICARTFGY